MSAVERPNRPPRGQRVRRAGGQEGSELPYTLWSRGATDLACAEDCRSGSAKVEPDATYAAVAALGVPATTPTVTASTTRRGVAANLPVVALTGGTDDVLDYEQGADQNDRRAGSIARS
ncbi:MAG: hypothetical protein KatS3mg055_3547 [Chloroflexus sp.]|uniref:hypothetical protein n=1 Tax=Chloroflexus sp. TaxID=1904827 RepID=UPI0021DD70FB|nr:hypothetical protein [Chloroflexus sp.]GIV91029.1 MAG: hypothetical protein KatS3mg055_3547 [Chloroflexus sp.]